MRVASTYVLVKQHTHYTVQNKPNTYQTKAMYYTIHSSRIPYKHTELFGIKPCISLQEQIHRMWCLGTTCDIWYTLNVPSVCTGKMIHTVTRTQLSKTWCSPSRGYVKRNLYWLTPLLPCFFIWSYLTTVSVPQTIQSHLIGWLISNELQITWEEAVVS
jgi:hypothetical protein